MPDTIIVVVVYVLAGVAALLAIALILRSLFLWFWRINDLVDLLRRQNELLANLAGEPTPDPGAATSSPSTSRPQ